MNHIYIDILQPTQNAMHQSLHLTVQTIKKYTERNVITYLLTRSALWTLPHHFCLILGYFHLRKKQMKKSQQGDLNISCYSWWENYYIDLICHLLLFACSSFVFFSFSMPVIIQHKSNGKDEQAEEKTNTKRHWFLAKTVMISFVKEMSANCYIVE